jgi:hypothetical protein
MMLAKRPNNAVRQAHEAEEFEEESIIAVRQRENRLPP